ncbi:hypothetical protein [Legionella clemsonensis]|uniref:Uncharacterized protein n=1 Tax=Legionella clemsonensis TaxID=1867846 RepID=A0A222P4A7_9GAMM|nr:hypothetical protein [Legionella clemsonensis]ASQ46684.1 hypothetical protein clem_10690 [Legionella clemsonensis]
MQLLQNTSSPFQKIDFKLELASFKLGFWAQSHKNKTLANHVKTMVSEVKKEVTPNNHQSELYLEALIKTIDLISHENNAASRQDYHHFLRQFKKRESISRMDKAVSHYMLFSNVILSLSAALYITGLQDWRIDISFYSFTGFFWACILKGAQADRKAILPLYQVKDTPLSLVMQQVVTEAETDSRPIRNAIL